jgi:hypothetical protein
MAANLGAYGIKPIGQTYTFFQPVDFIRTTIDSNDVDVRFLRGGIEIEGQYYHDFYARGRAHSPNLAVTTDIVFVGMGIVAPEYGVDNYKNVDVQGKIVLTAGGAPTKFNAIDRAIYSSGATKAEIAAKHGAIGRITFADSAVAVRQPSKDISRHGKKRGRLTWVNPDGTPYVPNAGIQFSISCSRDFAAQLIESEGKDFHKMESKIKRGENASFTMGTTVSVRFTGTQERFSCKNIVGMLEGSDPKLKNEYLVLSAHLDHLGIRRPVAGDAICNGTLDNASGSVGLLTVAKAFSQLPTAPKRSLIFLWVTAEEMGLLGSDRFSQYPTIPQEQIVANVNIDIMGGLYDPKDIVAQGYAHSNLATAADFTRDFLEIELSPDPMPDRVRFVRSDQFSFVKQGIPAMRFLTGFKAADAIDGQQRFIDWRRTRFHKPSDDLDQPLVNASFVTEAQVNFVGAYYIANEIEQIEWNQESSLYKKYGAN